MGDWTSITTPVDAYKIAEFPSFVRTLKGQLRDRMAKEHAIFADAALSGGEHKQGSANVYLVADAAARAAQTTRPDTTTALDSDDNGRLLFQVDTGELYKWVDSAWVIIELPTTNLEDEAVTNGKLKAAVAGAGGAVDTNVINDGAIETAQISDLQVTTAKLATYCVETIKIKDLQVTTDKLVNDAVTEAKMADGAGFVSVNEVVFDGVAATPTVYTDLDLSAKVGARAALVMLYVVNNAGNNFWLMFKRNGDADLNESNDRGSMTRFSTDLNQCGYVMVPTDASGIIEWKGNVATAGAVITLVGYIK